MHKNNRILSYFGGQMSQECHRIVLGLSRIVLGMSCKDWLVGWMGFNDPFSNVGYIESRTMR